MKFSTVLFTLALAFTVNAAAVDTIAERDALAEFEDFALEDLEFDVREAEAEADSSPEEIFAAKNCKKLAKKVPSCARPCITKASRSVGCGKFAFKCQCGKQAAIQSRARACVINKCGIQKALKARAAAKKVCKCVRS